MFAEMHHGHFDVQFISIALLLFISDANILETG